MVLLTLQVGYDAALVLSFECPEEVLEQRLLSRNQVRWQTSHLPCPMAVLVMFPGFWRSGTKIEGTA